MNKLRSLILIAALVSTSTLFAGVSPHETVTQTIDGNKISITYGRPYSKKPGTEEVRPIWGKLVPYGAAWRMGADQATTLVTEKPIVLGGTEIPAGKHTLYVAFDDKGEAKLAVGSKTGQWGIPVDEKNDVTRVEMKREDQPLIVDQFTIAIEPKGKGGIIKMSWEKMNFWVAFTNK